MQICFRLTRAPWHFLGLNFHAFSELEMSVGSSHCHTLPIFRLAVSLWESKVGWHNRIWDHLSLLFWLTHLDYPRLKLLMRTHTLQSPLGSRNCPQAAAILSLRFLVTMHKGHRISTGSHRSPHFIMSRAFIQSLVFLCHRSADPETWRFMMTFSRFSQGKSCLNVFKMSDKLWLPSIVDLQHIVDLHWNC